MTLCYEKLKQPKYNKGKVESLISLVDVKSSESSAANWGTAYTVRLTYLRKMKFVFRGEMGL